MSKQVNIDGLKSIKSLNAFYLILTLAMTTCFIIMFLVPMVGEIVFLASAILGLIIGISILVKLSAYKDLIKSYTTYMVLFIIGFFIPLIAIIGSICLMSDKDISYCLNNSEQQ